MEFQTVMRIVTLIFVLLLNACASQSPNVPRYSNPDDFDPVDAAKTRISLGLTYLKNGNYSQAKFNLDKALEFAPRLADSHYSMAYYYQIVGETERANSHYQNALDFAPRNPDIANSYGAFLCQQGEYEQAKHFFLKAVNSQNYVSSAETYENLALCSQSQGKISDAIEYLQTAVKHQPSRSKSLILLAELQASQDQWTQAKDTLKRLENIGRVTADTLYLSAEIEQALGNHQSAKDYGNMLVKMYPAHANSKKYLRQIRPALSEIEAPDTALTAESKPTTMAKTQAVETLPKAAQTAVQEPEQLAQAEQIFHTVKQDENLYRISLQYNLRLQKLIEWNQLQDASSIYTGKKLYIVDPNSVNE